MKKTIALILFAAAAACLQAQTLSWDIRFFRGNDRESIPISQIIRMETGEPFQIHIIPASDCYSYIISYDSERKIHVLYDKPLKKDSTLPFGPIRLQEPAGTETLYVIMSLEKQEKIETLLLQHKNNPDSNRHTNDLRREIVKLQNELSKLGEPASAFIPSGGTTRSNTPEYTNRFTGKSAYVRTITIRH